MEQMRQNEAGALTAQAVPQKDVEQACFHALGLIGRNCEYLDQHLAHVGADQQTRQAVNDISAAAARLDRTVNEVMSLLDFLRTEEDPRLYPLDLCQLLQQVAAQAGSWRTAVMQNCCACICFRMPCEPAVRAAKCG